MVMLMLMWGVEKEMREVRKEREVIDLLTGMMLSFTLKGAPLGSGWMGIWGKVRGVLTKELVNS